MRKSRPSRALFTLHAHLRDLAIVSWAVPKARLQALLPVPLVPQTFDDAGEFALVSMAMMLDTTGDETYEQLNERAYVMKPDGTGKGAFFWKSHAATWQAFIFRSLLGIPEEYADLNLRVERNGYTFERNGRPVAILDLDPGRVPIRRGRNARFADAELKASKRISENPLIGYTLNWGELCATPVTHDRIDAQPVYIELSDASFMIPSVAIDAAERTNPLIAVYQRETPFHIGLPPRPIAGRGYLEIFSSMLAPWST